MGDCNGWHICPPCGSSLSCALARRRWRAFKAAIEAEPYTDTRATGWSAIVVIAVTLWVLIGVPNQAFKVGLGDKGEGDDAQRVLLRLITVTACALTGVYLYVMHLPHEPLYKLPGSTVTAGIIFTVLLVAPFYRSLATAIWQRGMGDVIGYRHLMRHSHRAGMEARRALDRSVAAETRVSWLRGFPDDWYGTSDVVAGFHVGFNSHGGRLPVTVRAGAATVIV